MHKANTNAIKLKVEYRKCSNTHAVLKFFKFGRVNGVDGKLKLLVLVCGVKSSCGMCARADSVHRKMHVQSVRKYLKCTWKTSIRL